jgi:hypothetical protein
MCCIVYSEPEQQFQEEDDHQEVLEPLLQEENSYQEVQEQGAGNNTQETLGTQNEANICVVEVHTTDSTHTLSNKAQM